MRLIIPNDVGGTFQARADAFQAKLDAQFAAGVRGFLAWAWSPQNVPASTLNNYDIGPSDPALGVLAAGPDDDFAWSRTFLDPDAEDIDFLGYSVDYHGSGYVVGAPFEHGRRSRGLRLRIPAGLTVRLTLRNPDPGASDFFGYSVASVGTRISRWGPTWTTRQVPTQARCTSSTDRRLSRTDDPIRLRRTETNSGKPAAAGGRLIVGAPYDDLPGAQDGGTVFVFDPDTGALTHEISNPFPTMPGKHRPGHRRSHRGAEIRRFGLALAPSGTEELLVGAPQESWCAYRGRSRLSIRRVDG